MQRSVSRLKKDLAAFKVITLVNSVMLCLLLAWSFIKPVQSESIAMGGNVDSVISVGVDPKASNRKAVIEKAHNRGYYTASEFAIFEGIDKRTVYRRLESGVITNAQKVDGRWRIFCD